MAAFADIVLADGTLPTPVNHTFAKKANDNLLTTWEDRVSGSKVGYGLLKMSTKDSDQVRRVRISFALPTLEVVSGTNSSGFTPAPTVAFTERADVEFILHNRGTAVSRRTLLKYLQGMIANAAVVAVVVDGEEVV